MALGGVPGLQVVSAAAFHERYHVREDEIADPLRDHIAHIPDDDLPSDTFHLVDPEPMSVGKTLNEFAKAAHAPQFAMRIDPHMTNAIPKQVRAGLKALPTIKRIRHQLFRDLGIRAAA